MKNAEAPKNLNELNDVNESERRFQAIVGNIQCLVFQLQMRQHQPFEFIYLSDGCADLLGMPANELVQDPEQLFGMMNSFDKNQLKQKMQETAATGFKLNWEGRVWIDGWQDIKWVNIRATTHRLENGDVQWDGIMLNITQSMREKQELEQSKRDIQQLSAHLNHIKEQERISIAREIHDDLGGNLTAIKMGLKNMCQQLESGKPISLEQTAALDAITSSTFDAVHRISGNLRPNILDLGIVDALEWQLKQFKKQLSIDVTFTTNKTDITLDSGKALELFRICQEALSNIAKHAKATLVSVTLNEEQNQLTMCIEDNGVGIKDADKIKLNAYGLKGMQERILALGGEIEIGTGSDGAGTKISLQAPI